MARQAGKSSYYTSIADIHAAQLAGEIDKDILNSIFGRVNPTSYNVKKSWYNRRGVLMHRVSVGSEIEKWLRTEHSQYGISNPDWWLVNGQINISDRLFNLLVLKFE